VLAWVDPDNLETITITDLERKSPQLVERADPVPVFCDDPDQIRDAMHQLAAHNRYGANLYRIVSSGEKPPGFRRVVVDRQTLSVGAEMKRQAETRQEQTETIDRLRRSACAEARKLGVMVPTEGDPERLRDQADALRKIGEVLHDTNRGGSR
jgi:hypothetical protein